MARNMSSRGHRTPERRRGAPAGGSDGVGAWDTGGGTGADIDVAGLDEATRSQFEFLVSPAYTWSAWHGGRGCRTRTCAAWV